MMWMEFGVKRGFQRNRHQRINTFSSLVGVIGLPPGFIGCANAWQAFFSVFRTTDADYGKAG